MFALCRSSGIGSLLFIFPNPAPLVCVLVSLLTGDALRTATGVVATQMNDSVKVDENGEARMVSEPGASAALTKLITHAHTPFLRANRGLTLCTLELLSDILLKAPTALADYRTLVTFVGVNLDAAITGAHISAASLSGRESITTGISQYSPLQCGIDRVDDGFVLGCLETLTVLLRAHRHRHETVSSNVEQNQHVLPSFLHLLQRKPAHAAPSSNPFANVKSSSSSSFNSNSSNNKLLQQTMQLREIVSSKLLALGDSLLLLGTGAALRRVLRLMVRQFIQFCVFC